MSIQLKLNTPTPAIKQEGWAIFRTSAALKGAIKVQGTYQPSVIGFDLTPEAKQVFSPNLWQEPDKGVVMLRPTCMRPGFMDEAGNASLWLRASNMRFQSQDLMEIGQPHRGSNPPMHLTTRPNLTTELVGITAPLGYSQLDLQPRGLKWIAESNDSLFPNEAWSAWVIPFGHATDGAQDLCAIAFGGRWLLKIDAFGLAQLWENAGTTQDQEWVVRKAFACPISSANPENPIQIAVIPWGIDALSIFVGEGKYGHVPEGADYGSQGRSGILFESRRYGFQPTWNAGMRQYIKTEAAPFAIALPAKRYASGFSMLRMRYDPCGLAVASEHLDELHPETDPTVQPIGFWGQNKGGAGANPFRSKTDPTIGVAILNQRGEPWNAETDQELVAETWLVPDSSRVYTPELWALSYEQPPILESVEAGERDLSDYLIKVQGTLKSQPDSSVLNVTLLLPGEESANSLSTAGQVQLHIDDSLVFEGFMSSQNQTWTTPNASEVNLVAYDLWELANQTSASHFVGLTGHTYADLIRLALERIGATEEEIEISPELELFEVEGFVSSASEILPGGQVAAAADDWKVVQENGTVGDVLRILIDRFAAQGHEGAPRCLEVLRDNGIWKARLSTEYDAEEPVSMTFHLQPTTESDQDRWEETRFKVMSSPRFGVQAPAFNALRAYAATGSGEGAEAFSCFIAPASQVLSDPAHPSYQAVRRTHTLGPPDTAFASTQNELERMARSTYDRLASPSRTLSFEAEWNPEITPGQLAQVTAVSPTDDPDENYRQGDLVSLGVYRIDRIDYEVRPDHENARRFRWLAEYSLTYHCPAAQEALPDFNFGELT